jgi:carboxypeptidase C (cathepsin A)
MLKLVAGGISIMGKTAITLNLSLSLVLLAAFGGGTSFADLDKGSCSADQKNSVTTSHTTMIGGKSVSYSATAGYMEVTAQDGKSKACIFNVAYTVAPAPGQTRPVTFAFNGGPGSASLFLHMGLLGPQRVDMGTDGLTVYTPFHLIDNDYSPLDVTDIVLIDPVATGFSTTLADATDDAFFGAVNDYASIEVFIQNYLNASNRWNSPKFILGESLLERAAVGQRSAGRGIPRSGENGFGLHRHPSDQGRGSQLENC